MAKLNYIRFNVPFYGGVSEQFKDVFRQFNNDKSEAILVEINSPGGSIFELIPVLDVIQQEKKKPIIGVCSGMSASCGAALLMATDYRVIGQNSYIMLHQGGTWAQGKMSEIEADFKLISEMTNNFVYDLSDKAAKKPPGYTKSLIKENFNADLWINAEQALKHGYADDIGTVGSINIKEIIKKLG